MDLLPTAGPRGVEQAPRPAVLTKTKPPGTRPPAFFSLLRGPKVLTLAHWLVRVVCPDVAYIGFIVLGGQSENGVVSLTLWPLGVEGTLMSKKQ